MRTPDAPFLELGFYFRQKSGREAFRHLVSVLTEEFGAVPANSVVTDQTANCLSRANESAERIVKTTSGNELNRLLDDSSKFVRKVTLEKGTRIVRDAQEYVVVLPINGADCQNENNAVAVWIEGEALSRASNDNVSNKEKKIAVNTFETFKKLVSLLQPAYGAITVDYGLETPCDLRLDSRSLAFRDFYLDGNFGENFLGKLKNKFPNSVYNDYEGGLITTTTTAFRVAAGDESVGHDGYELSQFVGRSIGNLIT